MLALFRYKITYHPVLDAPEGVCVAVVPPKTIVLPLFLFRDDADCNDDDNDDDDDETEECENPFAAPMC